MSGTVPALWVNDVAVRYPRAKTPAISAINLTVMPGEVLALVGANGAGKTTFLKTILGLLSLQSGTVKIFGCDVELAASRRRLVFLPERFDPAPFLTGRQYIRFALRLYNRSYCPSDVMAFAKRVALAPEALAKRIGTYSKGMRQKLGIMICLLSGADLWVLDEPMSGLDPIARSSLRQELAVAAKSGKTIFMSSHDLSDIQRLGAKLAVISDGKMVFQGTADQMKKSADTAALEDAYLYFAKEAITP